MNANIPYLWIGRQYCLNVNITQAVYKFSTAPVKISMAFFFSVDTENPIPKFMWNLKGPLIARIVLKKKKKNWRPHFLISKFTTNQQQSK